MIKTNKLVFLSAFLAITVLCITSSFASTLAYWNFDQGTDGTSTFTTPVPDQSGNGHTMYGWSLANGGKYQLDPVLGSLTCRYNGSQDTYTNDSTINSWSPLAWTIEVSASLDNSNSTKNRTIIGRDGKSGITGDLAAVFYLQCLKSSQKYRIDFQTVGGKRYTLDSDFSVAFSKWYSLAVVSDGSTLTMYADKHDGLGYVSAGSLALDPLNDNRLRPSSTNGVWTFGRGCYNGANADKIYGNLDEIRFSDSALTPDQFLVVPEPATFVMLSIAGLVGLFYFRKK